MFDIQSSQWEFIQHLLGQFHFIRPWWLLLLLPLTIIGYWKYQQDPQNNHKNPLPAHLQKALRLESSNWGKQLPLKLLILVFSLGILVCAGPSWQKQVSPFEEDKAPLLIILDSSLSMLEKDVMPNRLSRAKQKITDLLMLRGGGKTGLIVYSGSAHLVMPLTQDLAVLGPYLMAIGPDIMPIEGKSAYKTIPLIKQQLLTLSKSKLQISATVLLITDAITTLDKQMFTEYFKHSKNQLLILGVGDTNNRSDFALNMHSLNALADLNQGGSIQLSVDDQDINWLNHQIKRHMQLSQDSAQPWEDLGYYLLYPILLLTLLWFRRGWLVRWCLAMIFIGSLSSYSPPTFALMVSSRALNSVTSENITLVDKSIQYWMDLWLSPDQQGQWYFDQKHYALAGQHFQDPLRKGIAFYYAAEYKKSYIASMAGISDLQAIIKRQDIPQNSDPDPIKQQRAETTRLLLFNAANALLRQREYLAARDLFKIISKHFVNNKDAKHNLILVQHRIDEINLLSESQANTGEVQSTLSLADKPRIANGADEKVMQSKTEKLTLSAAQILADKNLANKWLRRVEADPKYFLKNKFHMQILSAQGNE
ncbi:transporter [Psychromonas sp. CNPT3]|uniref:vWA domain-containing protein n=1 Tax=Psychromonas sp. CNPT3 TaxID=314282 RepID=UPI00006E3C0D|nr:VWA domain-containing protein [Psychromonas sp. CNPT3]AGH81345.1 transporter [Psychromonas sp. CNPT3]